MVTYDFFPAGSFAVHIGDHFRSNLGIICGRASFAVLYIPNQNTLYYRGELWYFRVWCSLRFADFLFLRIWFSIFVKNTSGFSDMVSDVAFAFSYLGFGFSSISAPALISNSREMQLLYRLASHVQSHVRPNNRSHVTD